ncbi:MAG TPA: XRE family transcriptional regulator [Pseudonocardiaceae bacterium]|nr:XRE family transcriptional regulator [Pseudonocardiaceae bacterium]
MSDMPESTGTEGARRCLADKLNYLFTVVRPPGADREYTGREVVAAINEAGGEISASHLSELRRGLKTNPTVRVLDGLAQFFGIRVAYFLDDPKVTEEVEAELELRKAMHDAQVRDVALRVAGLTASQRSAMYRLLAEIIREHNDQ